MNRQSHAQEPTGEVITTGALVIGAGPAGLFAAFELGMEGVPCHVVDAREEAGGQCTELYPDKPIYDIPAHPRLTGRELTERLIAQAAVFSPVYHFGERAEGLEPLDDGRYRVSMASGLVFEVPVVVIAAGGGIIEPRRPPIPGLAEYEGRSVFYAVKDRAPFRGRDVVIAGGGDSALDWALELAGEARRVTLLHRRPEFRAAADTVARMKAMVERGEMDFVLGQIRALEGEEGRLSAVIAAREGETLRIPAERLLLFFGLSGKMGALAKWGLRMQGGRFVVDTARFETSRPGIFAIGDACTYPGKLNLILSGFHEAALMAHAAAAIARPEGARPFMHSTSMEALRRHHEQQSRPEEGRPRRRQL
jgi:thioredoxin reductase (NADPH)